jgi:hypothetical protein
MEIASEAMITRNITNRAVENGKALIELTSKHGVILHDTPESARKRSRAGTLLIHFRAHSKTLREGG